MSFMCAAQQRGCIQAVSALPPRAQKGWGQAHRERYIASYTRPFFQDLAHA